jgi:hypothetical protein
VKRLRDLGVRRAILAAPAIDDFDRLLPRLDRCAELANAIGWARAGAARVRERGSGLNAGAVGRLRYHRDDARFRLLRVLVCMGARKLSLAVPDRARHNS